VRYLLLAVLAAATLAACSEKPPRTNPEPESVYNHEQGEQNLLRERTVNQGESGRMSY